MHDGIATLCMCMQGMLHMQAQQRTPAKRTFCIMCNTAATGIYLHALATVRIPHPDGEVLRTSHHHAAARVPLQPDDALVWPFQRVEAGSAGRVPDLHSACAWKMAVSADNACSMAHFES